MRLPTEPIHTVLLAGFAFFQVKSTNGSRIVWCEIDTGREGVIELPGASAWEYQHYRHLHPAAGSNTLHFQYAAYGKPLGQGTNYRDGYYSFDPASGAIGWVAEGDEEYLNFRTADGRYVFFIGPNAPIHGTKLVLSRWDDMTVESEDPEWKETRLLHRFVGIAASYSLEQLSPCRRFAWVRRMEPVWRKTGEPGEVNDYYVVDLSNGKTTELIEERVAKTTAGYISHIRWVGR